MGLKRELDTVLEKRFKEFDEARIYIEEWESHSFEDVCLAIDYMLVHKEYYYLLKTLYNKRFCEGVEEVADYLFSRLDCLSRQADREMVFKFLQSETQFLQEKALLYILGCCESFDVEEIVGKVPLTYDRIRLICEYGECESVHRFLKVIEKDYRKSLETIEKFFSVYGDVDVK